MADRARAFTWQPEDVEIESSPIRPRRNETREHFVDRCVIADEWGEMTENERRELCENIYAASKG